MVEELIFIEEDLYQSSVTLCSYFIHPFSQCLKISLIIDPISDIELGIEGPIFLMTTPPDKIDGFSSLEDLSRYIICQETRDHLEIQVVFLSPEPGVGNSRIHCNEELLVRIVEFSLKHPGLNHCQHRSRDLP